MSQVDNTGLLPPAGHIMILDPDSVGADPHALERYVVAYRTKSGLNLFRFSIEQVTPGAWRVFILEQPDYGNRSEDAHITHRLSDYGTGRRYVCWDSPIRTRDDATKIAVAWAEGTEAYIRFGKHF